MNDATALDLFRALDRITDALETIAERLPSERERAEPQGTEHELAWRLEQALTWDGRLNEISTGMSQDQDLTFWSKKKIEVHEEMTCAQVLLKAREAKP